MSLAVNCTSILLFALLSAKASVIRNPFNLWVAIKIAPTSSRHCRDAIALPLIDDDGRATASPQCRHSEIEGASK
jgi:hypothetical protein